MNTEVEIDIVNAFVEDGEGGNPAGVVLSADGLDAAQRLAVAQRVGLSETAFVSRSDIATIRLEFFTPERQIAHCGHATIATFCRLRELGRISDGRLSKETIDGVREIVVDGGMASMEQKAPVYRDITPGSALSDTIAASLGLDPQHAPTGMSVVHTGNAFLLVPMASPDAVRALAPDMERVREVSETLDLIGYYVFSPHASVPSRHAGARMFAPRYGIDEESATGMAAGPLACYLHDRMGLTQSTVFIEQGRLMPAPSPSVIRVELDIGDDGRIRGLMAGGRARSVRTLRVTL